MSATVIGTVESAKVAQKAIDELLKAGFKDQDVEILKGDEDEIVAVIVERGFDEDDARGYAKAVSRGKTVVAARAVGAKAEKAAAIIERYETAEEEGAELDRRAERVRGRGDARGRQEQGRDRRCSRDHPRERDARSRRPLACATSRSRSSIGRPTAS